MDFVQAVQTCCKKWVTFTGRASRSEYWWFFLFNFLLFLIVPITGLLSVKLIAIIFAIAYIYLTIAMIAVAIRRLHDIDRTGWWILIGLVPVVGFIVLLIFYLTPGTEGSNQYG